MWRDASFRWAISVTICLLFICFHAGANYFFHETADVFQQISHISKIPNTDASLSIPYLNSINKFWHVGGSTEIRNSDFIRLTKYGKTNDHGIIISNGIGDNTMDNLEIIVKFKISSVTEGSISTRKRLMGDGMAIVLTPEKEFATQDLRSSYAKKQYEYNSGGILPGNTNMMGFPSNLPGMALIIDTYQNVPNSRKIVPFMDAILNVSPKFDSYDAETDGSRSSTTKLTERHMRLKESVCKGGLTKLRIIYLESINFLKVDIQYDKEGSYWIELFQKQGDVVIPKNTKNGQRYIGIGALTGDYSETVDILDVQTNEFHWKDHDESDETSHNFAKEMETYFINEYKERLSLETDDFQRFKMLKSQPNYLNDKTLDTSLQKTKRISFFSITIAFCTLFIIIYLASVYIRVTVKHVDRLRRSKGLLPT